MAHAKKFVDEQSENVLLRDLFELAARAVLRAGCWSETEAPVQACKILRLTAVALYQDELPPWHAWSVSSSGLSMEAAYAGQNKLRAFA